MAQTNDATPVPPVGGALRRKPGPKPRVKLEAPTNGAVAASPPPDPVTMLRRHLAHLTAEATRLDAESTRVKRALQALQA